MAEKEERILIKKEINYHPPSGGWRGDGKEIVLTRSKAIERMAKALFKVDNVLALNIEFEQLTKQKQLTYKVFAEAALNALLEADK